MPDIYQSPNKHAMPETPSYGSASFSDFHSPPRNGPLGFGQVASLNELYHTPVGGFNLDKNLVKYCDKIFTSIFLFLFHSGPKKIVVI
jgi:hypothetical protein